MSSTIDSSKPADGTPAVKADLRANLEAARSELDHGGFALGLTPTEYGPPASSQVKDHLAAIDAALGGKADAAVGIETEHSLEGGGDLTATRTLRLAGDVAAPGANKVYGTDGAGSRGWKDDPAGGAATAFTGLDDTPGAYTGEASKFVKVKSDETGLEFVTSGGATTADAVDYTPPFTGGVTRTVESRLADLVTVEDFGAVGDGVTDDSAAIQAAVDSGAGAVFFRRKTYGLGTRIAVPASVRLQGTRGRLKALSGIASTGEDSCLIKATGNNVTVEAMNLDCESLVEAGIKVVGSILRLFRFSELNIAGHTDAGIDTSGNNTWMSVMERVRVDGGPVGFRLSRIPASASSDNTTLTLTACYAAGQSSRGFIIQCQGGVMNGCAVDNCGDYPIEFNWAGNFHLNGCDFEQNSRWMRLDGPNVNVTATACVLNHYDDTGGAVIDVPNGTLRLNDSRWFNGSGSPTFVAVASGKRVLAVNNNSRLTAEAIAGAGIVRELFENQFFAHN